MILASISAWLTFCFTVAISSWAAFAIVKLAPWSDEAKKNRLPLFFGLSAAPFFVGLMTILALGLLPGASHNTHIAVVLLPFISTILLVFLRKQKNPNEVATPKSAPLTLQEIAFLGLLAVGITITLFHSFFLPLTQNDSLEYLTVGKILFQLSELAAYPALAPERTASGFYGPWTHPPLYVSLIYLMNAIQGYADAPGLMRLIAPWFSLVTLGLIYSLGKLNHSRLAGLIAAVITLYTPLFFLGTESGLIDPLPITGLLIAITAMIGLRFSSYAYPIWVGLSIGIGMWSHSQTILFPLIILPVLFLYLMSTVGFTNSLKASAIAVGSCLALTFWPYLRNYFIFGSPISDNPIVFALPELNWPEYFQVARGYDVLSDKIQYGLFKGWFMLESYSWTFWLMTAAGTFVLATGLAKKIKSWSFKTFLQDKNFLLVAILTIYMVGVAASIAINIDLMIRNERYLLIMLPVVSLIGGVAISSSLVSLRPWLKHLLVLGLVTVFAMQLLVLGRYRWKSLRLQSNDIFASLEQKLDEWPQVKAMRFLRDHTQKETLVLSLLPADMYYSDRTMLSYLDPRLVPFYKASSAEEGLNILKELGVSYIHVPNYAIPPLYNSLVNSIINTAQMTSLVFSDSGFQIYKVRAAHDLSTIHQAEIKSLSENWTETTSLTLLGRKGIFRLKLSELSIPFSEVRQPSRKFLGEDGIVQQFWSPPYVVPTTKGGEALISIDLSGQGLMKFYISCNNESGNEKVSYVIGELLLNPNTLKNFSRRFVVSNEANNCKIGIEKRLSQPLLVEQLSVSEIQQSKP